MSQDPFVTDNYEAPEEEDLESPPPTTALSVRAEGGILQNRGFRVRSIDEAWPLAEAVVKQRMCPKEITQPGGVVALWQAGAEVGVPMMTALNKIHYLDGKLTMAADLAKSLVRVNRGIVGVFTTRWYVGKKEIGEDDLDELGPPSAWPPTLRCVVEALPRGADKAVRGSFSVGEAMTAALWRHHLPKPTDGDKRSNWWKYPKRMLIARASTFCCRDHFGEYIGGFELHEEWEDVGGRREVNVTPPGSGTVQGAPRGEDSPESGDDPLLEEAAREPDSIEDAGGRPVRKKRTRKPAPREGMASEIERRLGSQHADTGLHARGEQVQPPPAKPRRRPPKPPEPEPPAPPDPVDESGFPENLTVGQLLQGLELAGEEESIHLEHLQGLTYEQRDHLFHYLGDQLDLQEGAITKPNVERPEFLAPKRERLPKDQGDLGI